MQGTFIYCDVVSAVAFDVWPHYQLHLAAALNEAGDAASVDAPAKFECDLARGESDFEPVRVSFFLFNLCTGNSTDGVFCFYS